MSVPARDSFAAAHERTCMGQALVLDNLSEEKPVFPDTAVGRDISTSVVHCSDCSPGAPSMEARLADFVRRFSRRERMGTVLWTSFASSSSGEFPEVFDGGGMALTQPRCSRDIERARGFHRCPKSMVLSSPSRDEDGGKVVGNVPGEKGRARTHSSRV